MIWTIVRNGFRSLRRDRGAMILSFILPIAFFSIFGFLFGGRSASGTPRVSVIVVDEDQSDVSKRLVAGLKREASLQVATRPHANRENSAPQDYTASTAEASVKRGDATVALIIPKGFGTHPVAFGPNGGQRSEFTILNDSSDPIGAQVVAGMLQKTVMMSLPDSMASTGMEYFAEASGGLSPEQRKNLDQTMADLRQMQSRRDSQNANAATASTQSNDLDGMVSVKLRDVVGEKKRSPMIAFYAAGVGVMFLLFTASGAGGSLLDEADSGALDRVLSSRVSMTTLLAGKLMYSTLLAFAQLSLMFLWGALVFHVELFSHLPGFLVMTIATSFTAAAFGMLLASVSRTRAQQGAIGTLIILTMSAVGGSMFPRFIMPEVMKMIGLFTFNAWAIDGYTKVFWRDEPVSHLGPQVAVLVGSGIVLFLLARRFARKWEYA